MTKDLFNFQVGDPKDQVRNSIRNILRSLRKVYPVIYGLF